MTSIKIFRPFTLLLIAIAMYCVRHFLIGTFITNFFLFFQTFNTNKAIALSLSDIHFAMLVISTLLICAAGFVINDYFDTKADRVNKPGINLIGVSIKRSQALIWHLVLNIIGLVLAGIVAYSVNSLRLIGLQVFIIALLWLHPAYFKKNTVYNDLVLAFLVALLPIVVYLYEAYAGYFELTRELLTVFPDIVLIPPKYAQPQILPIVILLYSFMGFVTMLIYKQYRNLAYIEGDKLSGNITLPIYNGEVTALKINVGLCALAIGVIGIFQHYAFEYRLYYLLAFSAVFLTTPLIMLVVRSTRKGLKPKYLQLSNIAFAVLVAGIAILPVLYFTIML